MSFPHNGKNHWYWLEVKIWFFSWFCCANQFNTSTYLPPPSPPQALDYSLCPRSRNLKKRPSQGWGIWILPGWGREFEPELYSPSNGIKCLFFFDEECGNLNKPIFRSSNAQWGYPGRGVWCWSFVLIDTFCWKALRESFPRATKETMYKSLWSHKGLKPKQLSY